MQYISFLKTSLLPSILAGTCASIGSVFGKLAFSAVSQNPVLIYIKDQDLVVLVARVVLFIIMIVFNSMMMKMHLTSLKINGASRAAVYNFSVNYFLTAIFGVVFFGEIISLKWMAGASLMMTGISLIAVQKQSAQKEKKD